MDAVLRSRVAELGSQRVWPQVFSDFWIHWTDELPELLNRVLLPHFHNDARSSSHSFDHTNEFWQHALVNLEEFFGRRLVQCKHLHRRNLEAFLQDCVNDLTGESILNNMWLDNATGTIIEDCGRAEFRREVKAKLVLVVSAGGRGMHGIPQLVCTEYSAQ